MTLTMARRFRQLHEEAGIFVMPNPWDAGSAVLLAQLGFKALATTSAGLAFSLAKPDGENAVSREETLANASAVVNAVGVPVSADLENCFGDDPATCAATIMLAARTGLAGGSIEDSTGRGDQPIFDLSFAADRVKAAAEVARSQPDDFVLTARSENYLHGRPDLKDTIRRLQAYQEAGADVLFAPGLKTAEDIRAVTSSVDRPLNVVMGLQGAKLSVDDLASCGVKRVSIGGSLARAALGAMLRGAREIMESGTFEYAGEATPHGELNAMFAARR